MAHEILSHEELMDLIKQYQAGSEEAMERLMEHSTRLIWSVVQRFKTGHNKEDLFQVGVIGFMKAVQKFNFDFNVKFTTYAVPMIMGEIQRFIRDNNEIKIPRSMKDVASRINRMDLMDKTPEEISELLEIEDLQLIKDTLEYIHNGNGTMKSLEEEVFQKDGSSSILLIDQLSTEENDNWFEHLAIRQALSNLPDERDRRLLYLRYFKELTQTEVAEELGVSQVQVSRLEKKALAKLKDLYETKEDDSMSRQVKGDREAAEQLLEATSLTLKEISKETGVPVGTLSHMVKKYRPQHITDANKRKAKGRKPSSGTVVTKQQVEAIEAKEVREVETPKAEKKNIVEVSTPTTANKGTVVEFNFNMEGTSVSKAEAVKELRNAADLLEHVQANSVTFTVKVGN